MAKEEQIVVISKAAAQEMGFEAFYCAYQKVLFALLCETSTKSMRELASLVYGDESDD